MSSSTVVSQELYLDLEYANFWLRIAATLADVVVFWAIKFVTEWVLLEKLYFLDLMRAVAEISPLIVYTSTILLGMFPYLLIIWFNSSKYQGTPGKLLVGIKITDMNGERISFWRSLGRHYVMNLFSFLMLFRAFKLEVLLSGLSTLMLDIVGIIIFILCILLPVIGYLMIAFTARKQGIHDKLFGTVVVKR